MSEKLKPDREIEILNADALDVEELERRLEMAVSLPDFAVYCGADCGSFCGVDDCTNLCVGLCTTLCGVDGCATDCVTNGGGGCEDPTEIVCGPME